MSRRQTADIRGGKGSQRHLNRRCRQDRHRGRHERERQADKKGKKEKRKEKKKVKEADGRHTRRKRVSTLMNRWSRQNRQKWRQASRKRGSHAMRHPIRKTESADGRQHIGVPDGIGRTGIEAGRQTQGQNKHVQNGTIKMADRHRSESPNQIIERTEVDTAGGQENFENRKKRKWQT